MTVHCKAPLEQIQALEAYVKLNRALETVNARLNAGLAETDLTPRQLGVLEALLHLGPMCQRELGRKLLRGDPNMTAMLEGLERDGLVSRLRRPQDRRQIEVTLTEEGRRRIERVFPLHAQTMARVMGVLSPPELAELGRLCRKLGLANVVGGKKGVEVRDAAGDEGGAAGRGRQLADLG